MNKLYECRSCHSTDLESLINFGLQPVVHNLLTEQTCSVPMFPLEIGFCIKCSLIQLIAFFPRDIFYKNYLTLSSWKPQPHAGRLADLILQLSVASRAPSILEIGCNDGSFLDLLSARGLNNLRAFEPSLDAYEIAKRKNYDVIPNFFGTETTSGCSEQYDVIVSRQVFEHIDNPADFLNAARRLLKDSGTLVLEVPNFSQNLNSLDYSLWEEHVIYYTPNSLKNVLQKNGFSVFHEENTLFSGIAYTVFATKSSQAKKKDISVDFDLKKTLRYGNYWKIFKKEWEFYLEGIKSFYVYGVGARSTFFSNQIFKEFDYEYIDDQPEKIGKLTPGSGKKIRAWENSFKDRHILLGVNAENETRLIQKRELDWQRCNSILPPSRFIPEFWRELTWKE